MLRWSEILHTCSKTFGCPMHGLIQHLPDVCMVRYMHVYDSLDIYVSRNDFPLEGRKYRIILNKSPSINVLFWLQTVLDRCVTNVGNPHKKDYYVSQHTFVLWKLDLYDVATVLYWPAVQFKLYWVILSFFQIEYNFEYLQCPVRFVREANKNGGDIQPMFALNVRI